MKLKEFLEKTKCRKVSIGCAEGSAFFFCGDKDDPRIEEVCEWLEEKWAKYDKRRIDEYERKIKEYKEKLNEVKKESKLPSILEREVIQDYESIQDKNRVIITVSGRREGNRWDDGEFEKWYISEKEKREKEGGEEDD